MAEFLPLIGFVFFGLFSPGPNVILLTASGARFGFVRTVPHLLGVALGVGVIAAVTALGVGALILAQPALGLILKIFACGWILWMAYGLWNADPKKTDGRARPFTFIEAVLFQWVNPKVWAVALSATAYLPKLTLAQQAGVLAATFSSLNLSVALFWTSAGTLLAFLLHSPPAWRIFMRIMAVGLFVFSVLVFL